MYADAAARANAQQQKTEAEYEAEREAAVAAAKQAAQEEADAEKVRACCRQSWKPACMHLHGTGPSRQHVARPG